MRTLKLRSKTLAALLLLTLACAEQAPPPPARTIVDMGIRRVGFVVPPEWLHADHGQEQRFEHGTARIALVDLGPATPEGFGEALLEARELFERDQWEDARTLLVTSNPRRFFPNERRWKSVEADWKRITRIRRGADGHELRGPVDGDVDWEVMGAFHNLLVQVSSLRPRDLSALAESALVELDHGEQRSIASEQATSVSGLPAIRIDTWDRLSHLGRKSHLFVLSEGRLLCLYTNFGATEKIGPAFESLVASLTIDPGQPGGGAGGV